MRLKSYPCRVCELTFDSGSALGGHMRVHKIDKDPNCRMVDLDDGSDLEAGSNKRMYCLRTNHTNLKHGACEHCGEVFDSFKTYLDHGPCYVSEDDDVINGYSPDEVMKDGTLAWGNMRKRLPQSKNRADSIAWVHKPTKSDEDAAQTLVLLSQGKVGPANRPFSVGQQLSPESARKGKAPMIEQRPAKQPKSHAAQKCIFECKECPKVFSSYQALGGHCASHRKFKGSSSTAPAANDGVNLSRKKQIMRNVHSEDSHDTVTNESPTKKAKMHECNICHLTFMSGQALGGHKRSHLIMQNSTQVASQALGGNKRSHLTSQNSTQVADQTLGGHKQSHLITQNSTQVAESSQVAKPQRPMFSLAIMLDLFPDQPSPTSLPMSPARTNPPNVSITDPDLLSVGPSCRNASTVDGVGSNNANREIGGNNVDNKKRKLSFFSDVATNDELDKWLEMGIGSTCTDDEGKVASNYEEN